MDYKDLLFSVGSGGLFCFIVFLYERIRALEDKYSGLESSIITLSKILEESSQRLDLTVRSKIIGSNELTNRLERLEEIVRHDKNTLSAHLVDYGKSLREIKCFLSEIEKRK